MQEIEDKKSRVELYPPFAELPIGNNELISTMPAVHYDVFCTASRAAFPGKLTHF